MESIIPCAPNAITSCIAPLDLAPLPAATPRRHATHYQSESVLGAAPSAGRTVLRVLLHGIGRRAAACGCNEWTRNSSRFESAARMAASGRRRQLEPLSRQAHTLGLQGAYGLVSPVGVAAAGGCDPRPSPRLSDRRDGGAAGCDAVWADGGDRVCRRGLFRSALPRVGEPLLARTHGGRQQSTPQEQAPIGVAHIHALLAPLRAGVALGDRTPLRLGQALIRAEGLPMLYLCARLSVCAADVLLCCGGRVGCLSLSMSGSQPSTQRGFSRQDPLVGFPNALFLFNVSHRQIGTTATMCTYHRNIITHNIETTSQPKLRHHPELGIRFAIAAGKKRVKPARS